MMYDTKLQYIPEFTPYFSGLCIFHSRKEVHVGAIRDVYKYVNIRPWCYKAYIWPHVLEIFSVLQYLNVNANVNL